MNLFFSLGALVTGFIFVATTNLSIFSKVTKDGNVSFIGYFIFKFVLGYAYGIWLFNFLLIDHNFSAYISWLVLPIGAIMMLEAIKQRNFLYGAISSLLLLFFIGSTLIYPLTLANQKREIVEAHVSNKPMVETDQRHLPVVGDNYAEYIAKRELASWKQNISYFQLGKGIKQSIHGTLYYVFPIEYRGFFQWAKGQDIPGYIMVDAEQPNANDAKFVEAPMKYVPSAYFNENLMRRVRNEYKNLILMTPTLQIDDHEKPYYVIPYGHYTAYRQVRQVDGAILYDPKTGEHHQYSLKNVPSFVDQVIPTDVAEERMDWYGHYRSGGFINAYGILGIGASQTGVVEPTNWGEDDGVVGLFDNQMKLNWFTDFTNPTNDSDSMVGYALMNARTGELTYYNGINGLSGQDAKNISSKGSLNNQDLTGSVRGLYTIFGKPTWLVSLEDKNGVYRYTAFVDAQSEQIYAYDNDKEQALTLYQTALVNGSLADDSMATKNALLTKVSGEITAVYKKENNGQTTVQFLLNGQNHIFNVTTTEYPYAMFVDTGHKVTIEYVETKEVNVSVEFMKDLTLNK